MADAAFTPPPFTLDLSTGLSLVLAFSLMPAAQLLASISLPKTNTPRKLYWLFIWFAYDCLTHSILEAAFLYHSFFSYTEVSESKGPVTSDYPHPASLGSSSSSINAIPVLYGDQSRRYGAFYSSAPMARLWQEYAKADRRWGEADLTVVALEVLTVFAAGPAAAYACYLISKITNIGITDNAGSSSRGGGKKVVVGDAAKSKAATEAMLWFVAIVVSTGEIYGGFMTFAPEWLSGNTALAGDDPVYLWLYLVFFNTIWVWIPLWVMYEGFKEMKNAFVRGATGASTTVTAAASSAKAGKKA